MVSPPKGLLHLVLDMSGDRKIFKRNPGLCKKSDIFMPLGGR